jgi:hypothetical protein
VPSDPGPDLMQDNPHRSALQITVDEVQSVLLELDVTKSVGSPDGRPPLILKNCASVFAGPLSFLFFLSLSKCNFPDRWNFFYVTPIFKKGRRNNVEDYRIYFCGAYLVKACWHYNQYFVKVQSLIPRARLSLFTPSAHLDSGLP